MRAAVSLAVATLYACAGGGGPGAPWDDDTADPGAAAPAAHSAPAWVATDPAPATDTPAEALLRLALRFYGAQRSGNTGNWLLTAAGANHGCHGRDGEGYRGGLDLAGGWHDAGDHIKVTLTIGYTVLMLGKAYEAFPQAFDDRDDGAYAGQPNGLPDVLDEMRAGLDYLVKTHPDPNTLVRQVGNTSADHRRWVTCVAQEKLPVAEGGAPRPVLDDAGADTAGMAAAALAMGARLWRPFDDAAADRYLQAAVSIHALGRQKNGRSMGDVYTADPWFDDRACAATELHRTTRDPAYLEEARTMDGRIGAHGWVLSWSNVSDLCRHGLAWAGDPVAPQRWQQDVDRYTTKPEREGALAGMAYFDKWGSLRHALAAGFSAALYTTVKDAAIYRGFALSQLRYALGENGFDRSFVVGFGKNPPARPHHRNSYGYDDNRLDNGRAHRHPLLGALVGGPVRETGYEDDISDYVGNEVALDYNAALVGLAAFAVAEERKGSP